jgi:alpha-1,2-mannosyltransferase
VAAVTFFLLSYSRHGVGFGPYRIDLDVYRIGSAVWLHGGNLYGPLRPTSAGARLPFSYPPIAAVLLAPLALVPMTVATTALTIATIALAALVLRVFLQSVSPAARPASWWSVGWLLPAALFLEPVRNTLAYGQVNVALMALVAADCLAATPRWPRGALVGIAAAVKLTPAGFVLFFLLRRDWRAAGVAAVSGGACTAAGFALGWRDSVRYWTSVVGDAGRPGSPVYAANQSIEGVLARTGLDPHSAAGAVTWMALSAVVIGLAVRGMGRAFAASADAWALSLNAFCCLLISPVSWSHHWVWGETAVLTLAVLSWRGRLPRRLGLAVAAAGAVMFAVSPQWWFPNGGNRELRWAGWEQAIGSSYVIFAVVVLLGAACWRWRGRPAARLAGGGASEGVGSAAAWPGSARQPGCRRSAAPPAAPGSRARSR